MRISLAEYISTSTRLLDLAKDNRYILVICNNIYVKRSASENNLKITYNNKT